MLCRTWKEIVRHAVVGHDELVQINLWCISFRKRYVGNTFTILKRNYVEDFLEHLNTQHTNPFLDTLVIKDSEGRLTTNVYRKPTHTDQYLSYDSHKPQSVKRGVVKCLYDRSKNISTKPSIISEEKNHSSSVLVSIVYPYSIVTNIRKHLHFIFSKICSVRMCYPWSEILYLEFSEEVFRLARVQT